MWRGKARVCGLWTAREKVSIAGGEGAGHHCHVRDQYSPYELIDWLSCSIVRRTAVQWGDFEVGYWGSYVGWVGKWTWWTCVDYGYDAAEVFNADDAWGRAPVCGRDGKRQKIISMLISWWCYLKANIAAGTLQGSTNCGVLAAGLGGSGERESPPLWPKTNSTHKG